VPACKQWRAFARGGQQQLQLCALHFRVVLVELTANTVSELAKLGAVVITEAGERPAV
jgi:hypothetical protein